MFLKAEPVPLPEARRLICVGRLAEQKGLPILIAAAGSAVRRGRGIRADPCRRRAAPRRDRTTHRGA